MTEENTDFQEPTQQKQSYTVTATRQFEMDLTDRQLAALSQEVEEETNSLEAIEEILLQREIQNIEPEQKLLGADVSVNGSHDD